MDLATDPAALKMAALAAGLGYLLGSIPFGLILTQSAGLGDIRDIGSGNIGATNVLRTGHKGLALATLVLDMLKGTAGVSLGTIIAGLASQSTVRTLALSASPVFVSRPDLAVLTGLGGGIGAFLGHLFPVWLGFKGGKGVATYIGVLAGLFWPAALAFCAIWLATAGLTRLSSLAALVATVATPVVMWSLGQAGLALCLMPISLLLVYKHRANITRLLAGEEPRIGAKG